MVRFASETCSFDPSLGAASRFEVVVPTGDFVLGDCVSSPVAFLFAKSWRVCFLVLPVIVQSVKISIVVYIRSDDAEVFHLCSLLCPCMHRFFLTSQLLNTVLIFFS